MKIITHKALIVWFCHCFEMIMVIQDIIVDFEGRQQRIHVTRVINPSQLERNWKGIASSSICQKRNHILDLVWNQKIKIMQESQCSTSINRCTKRNIPKNSISIWNVNDCIFTEWICLVLIPDLLSHI